MGVVVAIAVLLTVATTVLGVVASRRGVSRKAAKRLFGANVGLFFGLLTVTTVILFSGFGASAAAAEAGAAIGDSARSMAFLGAALSTGLATIGAGIAVAFTGSAALGAISEDQSLLGKTIIIVGLAEGIAIYGLIISILILGQVG